ncbi:hypothetical protein BKE38_02785 [Pseudoroseomonas deserti]|uniref:IraD/Gp25-like domain-containing protein n=1 Tax=Teichococcus deserti TaxID=1817963 RepID=A0A1V2H827_9PROT|nr:hypothetical protein [Pseudoroseomonas deserti]ONG58584.1 hypothetical protein BKE38_02785 [Pseudoroseomonas deserti]
MAGETLFRDVALELVDSRALSLYRARQTESRRTGGLRLRDLGSVEGRDNLAQALVTRLLTPRGELAALGHPLYGSRLHEVVGALNNPTTHNLAKLFVIEALKQERRVARIVGVQVAPHPTNRFMITIGIQLVPVGEDVVLDFGPLALEL